MTSQAKDQSNFYFDANELRTQLLNNPAVVGIVVKSSVIFHTFPPEVESMAVLTVMAQGYDSNGALVPGAEAKGCPNPCNGGSGTKACQDAAIATLSFYQNKNLY